MCNRNLFRKVFFSSWLLFSGPNSAETTLVAVAANFSKPMAEISTEFEKATGHKTQVATASSGKLLAQIENGAPFDVFLSADEKGPQRLEEIGFAVPGTRFTYAMGKLVLWSAIPNFVDAQGKVLDGGQFKHLALADPKLAPYGRAAMETLKKLGLLDKLQPLMVIGESIAQTQQFVSTGNAELGFIALSQVVEAGQLPAGSLWVIPSEYYSPLAQSAVLLKPGAANPAANALVEFLKSPAALKIIKQYDYSLPD